MRLMSYESGRDTQSCRAGGRGGQGTLTFLEPLNRKKSRLEDKIRGM